ncbi:MAG TPA: FMN-binding protein [Actinophytocola sp.]|jgi:uncharacterized protein with FMN-binding domain|uniref:FMN-binding protein n=1 Tax=Actinophytocola sp. TaxID=1872138 RepID=UPI002E02771D|nr:FMN-binding protein [Actinophytocola sp.]
MHRAIPAVLITAAVFVVVWEFQPTPNATVAAPGVTTSQGGNLTVPGTAEATRWGTVQVEAVFSNGKLSDIEMLQTPRDRHATRAIPILRQEALQAQSADIDTVTGATVTSEAYARSLQAAIDAKRN